MMSENKLLEHKQFKKILSGAKRAAKLERVDLLRPRHFAAGVFLCLQDGAFESPENRDVIEGIKTYISPEDFELAALRTPFVTEKWKLSDECIALIDDTKIGTRDNFLVELCNLVEILHSNPKWGTSLTNEEDDRIFYAITEAGAALASEEKESQLKPIHLAKAAFMLESHFRKNNNTAITYLLDSNQRVAPYLFSDGAPQWEILPIERRIKSPIFSVGLLKKFEAAINSNTPMVTLINYCISEGAEIMQKEKTAYHEAGHAVISMLLMPEHTISEVSIIATSKTQGHVQYDEASTWLKRAYSKEDVYEGLRILLAGRIAEKKQFGGIEGLDVGACSDLTTATDICWKSITEWGMDPEFGPVALGAITNKSSQAGGYLLELGQRRLQQTLRVAEADATRLIDMHWRHVETVAKALLKKQKLLIADLTALLPELCNPKNTHVDFKTS